MELFIRFYSKYDKFVSMVNRKYPNRLLPLAMLLIILASTMACNINEKYKWRNRAVKHYNDWIPYDLLRPVKKMNLDEDLIEISGLTHIGNNRLACVEDETGNIYILDDETGEVLDKIKFHKFGDYEGIAHVGNAYYVVKSNGKIYQWENKEMTKYETALGVQNNIEGLCYDEVNKRLLLACKEMPGIGEDEGGDYRAVYAFDLASKKLIAKPIFLLGQEDIMEYVQEQWSTGEEIPNILFKPSGIAIHPKSHKVYIINYIGRILIVLNENGSLHSVLPLSMQYFSQPEGICFDENANLFISNEGGQENGNILRYKLKPMD